MIDLPFFRNILGKQHSVENSPNTHPLDYIPSDDKVYSMLGSLNGVSDTGIIVDETVAISFTAVYACVNILASDVASLPLKNYRIINGSKEVQDDNITWLLQHEPNSMMNRFQFFHYLMVNLLLRGNAYVRIKYRTQGNGANAREIPESLWPIHAERVIPQYKVDPTTGEAIGLRYVVQESRYKNGGWKQVEVTYDESEIIHIKGFSTDGILGVGPLGIIAESIGTGLSAERAAASLMKNEIRAGGVLEHPKTLGEKAVHRVKAQLKDLYSGTNKTGKTMVLEEGMTWKPLTINPKEAQLLESRKFSVADIARFFQVPLYKLGDLEQATHSNVEAQSIEYLQNSLKQWLERIESEFHKKLYPGPQARRKNILLFDTDEILRTDIRARFQAYKTALAGAPFQTINEIRAKEGLLPIDDGDSLLFPLNMTSPGGDSDERAEERAERDGK